MIFLKLFCIAWMLAWFFVLLKITITGVNAGREPFAAIAALITVWFLIGAFPVVIVKVGMRLL